MLCTIWESRAGGGHFETLAPNSRVELGQNWNYLNGSLKPIFYHNIGHVLSSREFKGDLGDFLYF